MRTAYDASPACRATIAAEMVTTREIAHESGYKTVGIYSGPLGFGCNTELLAKKKMDVPKSWADLLKREYKGEIQVANPASSGTAYTMVATLVQLMGEDKAFDYLRAAERRRLIAKWEKDVNSLPR